MDPKPYVILITGTFGLILLGAVTGNILENSGVLTTESLGSKGIALVLSLFFALFCIMAFSLVPLALRAFISLQVKIGNGEELSIVWMRENERRIVYSVWGLFAAGLIMAFVLARDEILKHWK